MQAEIIVHKPRVRYDFSYDEATWLMHVMQNPFNGETPDTEDEQNRKYRIDLFKTLKSVLDGYNQNYKL